MSYERKTRYEFIGVEWRDHQELVLQLNKYANENWNVEAHRISADTVSGWTVYKRYIPLNEPLLERNVNVGQIYSILNHVLEPGSDKSREFDLAIKQACKQDTDPW
jgi:hypothetical protein